MGPNGNPNNPNVVRQNLSAAERQASGDVGQICEICPDNWVEAGAIDETTGEPIPGIGYRIYDMVSGDQVASGVLNEKGESPRHNIPTPVTQLYVMFGTQEAMDEAAEQIGERQRAHALEQNAVSEWRGIPSGLDEQGFNQAYDQIAREAGRYEKPSVGLFEGAGYGANMLWDYVSSGFDSQHMLNELYLDDRRRNFEDYRLATNARRASDAESFFGGGGQGLTFGFGEEGMARLDTLFTDRPYEELVAERRQLMKAEQIANPNWFIGGEIAGAVPTIFVPVGGAAGRAVQAGKGTVGAVRAGATTGAVTGAVSGAGHDEGSVLDRADGALLGGLTGGMAGAVLSGAGVLIARGAAKSRIWGKISGQRSVSDRLDDLYSSAPKTKQEIDALAQDIAERHGGQVATAPLKGRERALEKVLSDYDGDTSRLTDVARNTIIVDRSQIQSVVRELEANGASVKIVDAATDPFGYSGVLSKVPTSNGMLGEIQVNTPGMIFAKEPPSIARTILGSDTYETLVSRYGDIGGRGHVLYEQGRSVGTSAGDLQRISEESRLYYDLFD